MTSAPSRLVDPLGRYDDRDEFQTGRLLVHVLRSAGEDPVAARERAEHRLEALQDAIPEACALARQALGIEGAIECIGLWIHADGSADYECTSFDDGCEEAFATLHRDPGGALRIDSLRSLQETPIGRPPPLP